MIAVIDYKIGNIRSVLNALEAVGAEASVTADPVAIRNASGIILPGVGAFGDGADDLRSKGLDELLRDEVMTKGKPFLGICVGMQLLATVGTEYGIHQGLGWIPGRVDRLAVTNDGAPLRLPHIGWNTVNFLKVGGLAAGLGDKAEFYFVHSFAFSPVDASVTAGVCSYGENFTACIEHDNIWATQFHLEKSQKAGLAMLSNWVRQL